MEKISSQNRLEYYKISSFIFLYFFTWSASIGLFAIWLGQKAELSGAVIGTVFAVNGIFSVILKPIYGYILDKIGMSKYLLYFVVIMSALMAPFFIYVYQPLLLTHTTVGIVVGKLAISMIAAYAVTYFRFPFRMTAFWLIFVSLMLPVEVRIIPTYEAVADSAGPIRCWRRASAVPWDRCGPCSTSGREPALTSRRTAMCWRSSPRR